MPLTPFLKNDILVSGFNEDPPRYPGGVWIVRDEKVVPLYQGLGVFGLAFWASERIVLGVTRVAEPSLIAFRLEGNKYVPLEVRYHNYVQARRAHGISVFGGKLFIVASQGDPDSVLCTNEDFAGVHVGKVIVSNIRVDSDYILVADSTIWNPYECDHHHHYNDILVDDNSIYLASFSTCDFQKQYVNRGTITRFNHQLCDPTIVTDQLVAPHSLQMLGSRLFVCSSSTSSVISIGVDPESSKPTLEFKTLNNFIRGLYVTDDWTFIGLSRSAGRTNSAHLTDSINGILKSNRQDGTTSRIEMPADCDNLYSILSVSD